MSGTSSASTVATSLPPNPFSHFGINLRKQFDAASLAAFRYPQLTANSMIPSAYFNQFHRAPPPPLLHPGVSGLYSPASASFQTLLANISAAQRPPTLPPIPTKSPSEYLSIPTSATLSISPPISPTDSNKSSTSAPLTPINVSSPNLQTPQSSQQHMVPSSVNVNSSPPPEDRRSSSIAALRLKAREHEIRLEMMRQNGHDVKNA